MSLGRGAAQENTVKGSSGSSSLVFSWFYLFIKHGQTQLVSVLQLVSGERGLWCAQKLGLASGKETERLGLLGCTEPALVQCPA